MRRIGTLPGGSGSSGRPGPGPRQGRSSIVIASSGLDLADLIARVDRRALGDVELGHLAGDVGGDLVLHLHRLDHADQRPLLDLGPLLDGDPQHRALQRRGRAPARHRAGAGAVARALALRRPAAAAGPAAARGGSRGADDLDGVQAAVDLDRVRALQRLLVLIVVRGRRGGRLRRQGLQPLAVLGEVAAGLAVGPLLGRQDRLVEGDQRRQRLDPVLAQRPQHARGRLLAVDVPGDQLGDHRVVERGHLRAGLEPRVDPDARPGGLDVAGDLARARGRSSCARPRR